MENILPTAAGSNFNSHSSMLAPGAILQNRYLIVRQLGKGGMGAVFEAVDRQPGCNRSAERSVLYRRRLRRQFEQETRLLAGLHHPALPKVSNVICRIVASARDAKAGNFIGAHFMVTYEGGGLPGSKRSVTSRFEYRADDRTLRDEEVDEIHRPVLETFKKRFNAEVRLSSIDSSL